MRSQLRSISTTSGFLEECPLEFSPGLNCIIGARGTCKSTLVESIRFVFDCDPDRVATLVESDGADRNAPTFGLIKETLRAGSVRCQAEHDDGTQTTQFALEREIGAETRIFVDGVREHAQRDVLHGIEVFSQGDLQRIAEDENNEMRLALIDRPNKPRVAELRDLRRSLSDQLRALGPQVRTIRAQISTLHHEAKQLESYESQLNRARQDSPAPTPELEAEREAHERRQQILDALRQVETRRLQIVGRLAEVREPAREILESVARIRAVTGVDLEKEAAGIDAIGACISELLRAAATVQDAGIDGAIESLGRQFEAQSDLYYRLRQEQQAVNESIKQQQALQRQVDHLTKQSRELERLRVEEKRLLEQRRALRGNISKIDDELYDLRIAEIDAINAEHGGTVQVTLGSSASTQQYAQQLAALLGGSRIRTQDEVAAAIAEKLPPGSLIDLVEAGNAQRLADVLNRDLGQMNRVVAHLADHVEFYGLESHAPASRLEITLYDGGQPKPVETLSKGQRATALLPIILRPLPYPLLFDQPEDDLDNKFIFNSLIKTIRSLKHQRQIIFVTHNANIPVLGGADKVIVMQMRTPSQAAPARVGSVDERKQEILDLLEGGAEAFAEREIYYRELLSPKVSADTHTMSARPDLAQVTT